MKFLRQGICLAVLTAGLAVGPGLAQTATAGSASLPAPDDSQVARMRGAADGPVTVRKEKSTGDVGLIRAQGDGDLLPTNRSGADAKSRAYLDQYAEAFGAQGDDLVKVETNTNQFGTTVSYEQEYQGLPVFGAELRANVDKAGNLTSVNGEAVPGINIGTKAKLAKADASDAAVKLVKAQPPTTDGKSETSGLKAAKTELVIYRDGLTKGEPGGQNRLVYKIEVTNERNIRDMVFIDANTAKVVNRYSMVADALDRELYEADEDRNLTLVWQEGDALPGTLNQDQQNLVASAEESYWFYNNVWDRDSYDDKGATMKTINNDPAIDCPNANWNGATTNYCDGVTSDDVVSHEWGHAVTEYTHGLIYQWQPGALNEAYSDIFGETIDLINDREDEGEGNLTRKRPDGLCSSHSPSLPQLSITAPAEIKKVCLTGGASFGAPATVEGFSGDVVIPTDAEEEGGTSLDGCSDYDQDVTGKIVMVDRGLCAFEEKAIKATEEGAKALIIGNRDNSPIGMSGDNPDVVTTVSIGLADRETIRTTTAGGETVTVTIKDATTSEKSDSFRWLVGEKSPEFGGAIRDMWNPTCYGDPGKVTDAEYKCSVDDHGGVHGNSGVPNHGYTLVVDGGNYNDTTVKGIGLDKAANIYYRAMTVYQTPASGFDDHADALEASCADLTDKAINKLSVAPDSRERLFDKITADDCAQVSAMIKAVELRVDPTGFCRWTPTLDKNTPALCGEGFESTDVFSEDFEDGLGEWTLTGDSVNGAFPPKADWQVTDSYRGDHTSTVAMGAAPDAGECLSPTGDVSSVNFMTSAPIDLPDGSGAPRMQFDHYIATEAGIDGGNVRIQVNGGQFEAIPAAAYTFNPPSKLTTAAEGNTNPLAGQDGFSGTDAGEIGGSWGTSQIDLAAAGVKPGDTVALQFAIGRDGCGGVDGWYVDNVKVEVCEALADITVKHEPEPSKYGNASELKVSVDGQASTPTGEVTVTDSDGKAVGSGDLDDAGKITFALPGSLDVGKHTFTVEYSGDDGYDAVTEKATATVVKATSTLRRTYLRSSSVRRGGTFVAEFTVSSGNVSPTGKVTLYKGAKQLGSKWLSGGKAKISWGTGKLSLGKNKITAKYAGSGKVAGDNTSFNVRVRR